MLYEVITATETGNATYVGLGVNNASTFFAPANVGDMTLKGSADVFAAPEDPGMFGMFYLHFFTRNCALLNDLDLRSQDCTEIRNNFV